MRRLGCAYEVFNSLARCDDGAVPFPRSAEGVEDLRSQHWIGQHCPDFIEYRYRWAKASVSILASDLLVDGSRDGKRDSGLQFRGLFQPVDVVADDVFGLFEFGARFAVEQLRVDTLAGPAIELQSYELCQLLNHCVLARVMLQGPFQIGEARCLSDGQKALVGHPNGLLQEVQRDGIV